MSVECRRKIVLAMILLSACRSHADWRNDLATATTFGGMVAGVIVLGSGTTLLAGGGNGSADLGVLLVGLGLAEELVCTAVVQGMFEHKQVLQLKMDHDTYLAGGEMTPFLQGLYREIAVQKTVLATDGKIDEDRMTQAIDRLLAMTEAPQGP